MECYVSIRNQHNGANVKTPGITTLEITDQVLTHMYRGRPDWMTQVIMSMRDSRPTSKIKVTVVEPTRLIVLSPVELFAEGEV